jgi:hypothetical protein
MASSPARKIHAGIRVLVAVLVASSFATGCIIGFVSKIVALIVKVMALSGRGCGVIW